MPTDAETAKERKPAASSAPPGPRKKKKKSVKRAIARPLTEQEINAPDRQTLIMLGVLGALAIVLWVFAHAACNYHPPRETRRPRNVSTADLTREPKDAAIEFQQRLLTFDYKGALEIAAGSLKEVVAKESAACAADKAGCAARRQALGEVISSATVVERGPLAAKVRVTTYRLPGGNKVFMTLAERGIDGWKVTARVPDGPSAELPAPTLNAGSIRFNTPSSAGGAASAAGGASSAAEGAVSVAGAKGATPMQRPAVNPPLAPTSAPTPRSSATP